MDSVQVALNTALDSATCFIETKDLDLGAPDFAKVLQQVYSEIEGRTGAPGLKLIIKYRDSLQDPLQELAPISLSSQKPGVNVRPPQAKYYRFRFEDDSISIIWKLSRMELFGQLGGRRF